jgi:hypothetical protein
MSALKCLFGIAALTCALVAPSTARADYPSGHHPIRSAGPFVLESRGFLGFAPGFGTSVVTGGDLRVGVATEEIRVMLGGRMGWAGVDAYTGPKGAEPRAAQFLVFDAGVYKYLEPGARYGTFVGGGISAGATYVDGFGFRNANLFMGYVEAGFELPRTSAARLVTSLRVDFGPATTAQYSRIPGEGFVTMFSLNAGFLFGGEDTRPGPGAR